MSEQPRVAIIVDSPYRDLPGMVLLAMHLCRQGLQCFLVPFNLREPELGAIAPDFVLLTNLRRKIERLAGQLKESGVQVGVLDTEGGVMPSVEHLGHLMTKNREVRHDLACYFTWGTRVASYLAEGEWFDDAQIVATGTPRLDCYADPWRQAMLNATPDLDQYGKNLILFNGCFTVGNPAFATPQQEARAKVEMEGFDPDSVRSWQGAEQESLRLLAELANKVAARFPEATVVYRPHPFERLETYHGLLHDLDNLHLIKEGSIYGWILRAKAVIQRGSSTAIEAGIAGVPALSASWLPIHFDFVAIDAVSIPCQDTAVMFDTVEEILADRFVYPEEVKSGIERVTREWYFAADGKSHERVAETILRCLATGHDATDARECLDLAYGLKRDSLSRRYKIGARARRYLRLPVVGALSAWPTLNVDGWKSSDKYFSEAHVRRLTDAIHLSSQSDNGKQIGPVSVAMARDNGDYIAPYDGLSVAISPA